MTALAVPAALKVAEALEPLPTHEAFWVLSYVAGCILARLPEAEREQVLSVVTAAARNTVESIAIGIPQGNA